MQPAGMRAICTAMLRICRSVAAGTNCCSLIGQRPSPLPNRSAFGFGHQHRPISISPLLLKVKKQAKKAKGSGGENLATVADACSAQLLEELDHQRILSRCQAEVQNLQESLYRNLRLQLTPDALHELEISLSGQKQQLGSIADIYQRADVIVIDLSANRHAISAVQQALSLKGFAGREQTDSDSIYVSLPKVTLQHRQRLAAAGREMLQRTKVSLRRLHDSSSKKLKEAERAKKHSSDELRAYQRLLVAQFKAAAADADKVWAAKEKELLG